MTANQSDFKYLQIIYPTVPTSTRLLELVEDETDIDGNPVPPYSVLHDAVPITAWAVILNQGHEVLISLCSTSLGIMPVKHFIRLPDYKERLTRMKEDARLID